MALLQTRGLSVAYGGVFANDAIDLECEPGRVVGLIGPNGAGKTTFVDAITGFTPITSGEIHFDGVDISHHRPHRRAAAGLVRTFQSLELFEDLSVRDNLLAAAQRPTWSSLLLDVVRPSRRTTDADEIVDRALATLGLEPLAAAAPSDLSHGQRKLVSVARALAARPKLLLLDEPAAGLDAEESAELGRHLRSFAEDGVGVFLIDHDMGLVLDVCDDVYVLDFGTVIAHGAPDRIRNEPAVITAYLGATADSATDG